MTTATGTELVPVDQLTSYPGNARRGDLDAIKDSLRVNGQYAPLIVQRSTGYVIVGNHRLEAARALGWRELEVKYLDVDDDHARRIVIADNRTSDLGGYDDRALVALLRDLGEDLTGTGYDLDDYDDLLAALEEADADSPPEEPGGLGAYVGQSGAYAEGGSAEGTNVRHTPSYAEYEAAYSTRATRFIALVYPLPQYAWIVERLASFAEVEGLDSNADAVLRLVELHTGDTAPDADAEVSPEQVAAADAHADKPEEAPA